MAQAPTNADELIELAAVVRAHGLRGEVLLKLFNPESELLAEIEGVRLKLPDGSLRVYLIKSVHNHSGQPLVALEGVSSRDEAEALRGSVVCVLRSELPEAGEDEYYLVDLVGLEVRDSTGKIVGKVDDVIQYPSVHCMVVSGADGSWEIPDTDRYVLEVQVDAGFVVVDHLDELDDLRPGAGKGARKDER